MNGNIKVLPFGEILDEISAMIDHYNVDTIAAYNMNFDNRAMRSTCRYLYDNENWLNRVVNIICIWAGACDTILNTTDFCHWVKENGFISDKGNPQTSAEVCFRYIVDNTDFTEEHTGGKDAEIEAHILAYVMRDNEEADFKPSASPWRKVAKTYKEQGF